MITSDDRIAAINWWQSQPFHPLICGADSGHEPLIPMKDSDTREVFGVCPTCGWKQSYKNMPERVFGLWQERKIND